jgi:zinc protease
MKAAKRSAIELRPLKLPHHEVRTLANGLTVHLVPRGPLPLVAVRLMSRAGSVFDPAGRLGLGDFAARLMRRGAAGMTANEISDQVEFVGASVGGFANEESMILSLSTPSQHLEAMFEIFAKVLRSPDYAEQEIELSRRRALAQLSNELDDPGSLADRALTRAIWGTHPYVNEALVGKADYEAFTRDDLVGFHRERLGPAISHLYVTGEFKIDAVMALIERTLGGWAGGPSSAPVVAPSLGLARPGEVIIVDKPEQTQVQVRIASAGVKRGHPDHFPLMVMNTVLGGGFTSRLVTEIRVKRGLSYGAGCAFDMMSAGGAFSISSFTKTETITDLIDVSLAEVKKMKTKGPTEREVSTVQRYISGLYPARLETNEAIAGALADVVHYGLTDEWIAQYRERIAAVSVKEAAAAAKKHLFAGERTIVLVGNAEALTPKVKQYGPVSVIRPSELE